MKKRLFAIPGLAVLALALGFHAGEGNLSATEAEENNLADRVETLVFDVATDARTFRLNKSGTLMDARRGDGFIVHGKIYPAGTIPPGGTMQTPGPFNPDTAPGSIGTWICRGTFNIDIGQILAGEKPHVFTTQIHMFNDGSSLVHDGPEGGATQLRALIGGMARFSGAGGEVIEEPLGINSTGLFNNRFTFKIKRKSLR